MGRAENRRKPDRIGETLDEALDLTVRHLADRVELSGSAALLLNRLLQEGPARLTVLATLEGVSQPAMTQQVQRLACQGLVERLSDPDDGRVAVVALTAAGSATLSARTERRRSRLHELLGTLSVEDRSTLELAAQVALPILSRLKETAATAALAAAESAPRPSAPR